MSRTTLGGKFLFPPIEPAPTKIYILHQKWQHGYEVVHFSHQSKNETGMAQFSGLLALL